MDLNKEENIINIKVIDREQSEHDLVAPTDMGMNLMEVLKSYELPVEGICGGMALCASCHCYIRSAHKLSDIKDDELAMLDETTDVKENSRLSCQIRITDNLNNIIIELAPESVPDDASDWL